MNKYNVFIFLIILILLGLSQSFYTVDETQRAIVLQLGKPVGDVIGPGIHFKIPVIQQIKKYDHRILEYDSPPAEVITKDKKTLVVDNYTRWRIYDPLLFYRTARTISGGLERLDDIVYSELRVALGKYHLIDIVSFKRDEIMASVTANVKKELRKYGIEIIDVRIKRTDLPPENQKAIYARMRSEREREAKQYRSEGYEQAAIIKAQAEKERAILLAEARKKAEIIKGEGDAIATKIYAEAYEKDPKFFDLIRSFDAYKKSIDANSTIVMSSDNEFLGFMEKIK